VVHNRDCIGFEYYSNSTHGQKNNPYKGPIGSNNEYKSLLVHGLAAQCIKVGLRYLQNRISEF